MSTIITDGGEVIPDSEPPCWIACKECGRPAHLLQGFTTGWYHEDDDTLVCGGRVWKRVPVASIARLWSPVERVTA